MGFQRLRFWRGNCEGLRRFSQTLQNRSSLVTRATATVRIFVCLTLLACAAPVSAGTLTVCASGCAYADLQRAIDAAAPGDTILLRAGETFVGPFVLRAKPSTGAWIVIRSDAPDSALPPDGVRLVPSGKPGANTSRSLLPRLIGRSQTYKTTPVISTEPGANHYVLKFLEIDGEANLGWETLIAFGDDRTSAVPHDIIVDRVYAHGHFGKGQKRGIALNSARTDILNSYISDIRAVGFDSQAICGWNGPGPFRIINNYLEAAGENIMFGGGDPAVQNLVPTGIEIRNNHIVKPLSWKAPILQAPAWAQASASSASGALSTGNHYFTVVALLDTGPVTAQSAASTEVSVSLSSWRSATLTWGAVPGAERYRIYRGTSPGRQSVYMETTSSGTSFSYTGIGERPGSPPLGGSEWVVKNLIELKNAQNVTVDGNVIENVWAAGQNGYAIVLTPRNQSGGASWVRVRDVTFSNNIIRNAAGVLTLVGYDDLAVSQQTRRVTFSNNLIYNIDPQGGWAKTFVLGGDPSVVVFDHNTIVHRNTSVLFAYGPPIDGVVFTNNVTLHNEYGVMGDNAQPGSTAINMYFPGGNVTNNVFAGGRASAYPAPNAFPTLAEWNVSFADPASHDYRLRSSSVFYTAGANGTVPGVNWARLYDATQPGRPGGTPQPNPETPPPAPGNTPPVARPGGPYTASPGAPFTADGSASSDAEGSLRSFTWRWNDDIVIYASDVPASGIVGSAWTRTARTDAANGVAIWNQDSGVEKIASPAATPVSYVDVPFYAAAGVPYRLWMRMRADGDAWWNDSVFLQFSGRVTAQGAPMHRIGTTSAARVSLEEGTGAGLSGWGWNDEAYGAIADPIYFATSGPQTIRIQQREDGVMWDQIVISAATYRANAPGATKNDVTIVPGSVGTSQAVVASHTYSVAGQFPIVLTVTDEAGASASAVTSVTVISGTGGGGGSVVANHGGPYSASVGQFIPFDGSRSRASSTAQYLWRFGDDIVIDPSDMVVAGSAWERVSDGSAARGTALFNPDRQHPKITTAAANPSSYIEATFRAAPGVPYRLWIRMRAQNDHWTNDSIFVQFSGSVSESGAAIHRIGTTEAISVSLEEGHSAGVLGWGWADGAYGYVDVPVYFNGDPVQRIRIQQREDGVRLDQIVISASTYATSAPGALKQDATIVPAFPSSAIGMHPMHSYSTPGVFPVQLVVVDGSQVRSAFTTATIR
jgi:hypothetical protein